MSLSNHSLAPAANVRAWLCAAVATATVTVVAVGLGLAAAPAAAAGAARCTIVGTAGPDVLRGTPGNDVICGLGGNDVINGGGGNDVINAGPGNDRVSGDAGHDVINGDAGNDSIDGGNGNDVADGGTGGDAVAGGAGDDALQGGSGIDRIIAGTGSDTCARDLMDAISGTCAIDFQAPTVKWITVPSEVTAGTSLTVTFSVKDRSGLGQGIPAIWIGGAPGWITSWCGLPIDATLVSGDAKDGVWSMTCPIPAKAVNDTYSLHLNAYDVFGNRSAAEVPSVRVTGGSADNTPPAITNVAIPTNAKAGEKITVTWRAADPSGVLSTMPWVYRPSPQFGVIYGDGSLGEVKLISGTATDGVYSQEITLPDNSVSGAYNVYISVRDELGNKSYQSYGSFSLS